VISLTPPCEMPPKHRQLHAPPPKASGNAYHALVDPHHDGNHLSFDGGDERTDGNDDNTIVNPCPYHSGPPASASPSQQDRGVTTQQWIVENILILEKQIKFYMIEDTTYLIAIDNKVSGLKADQHLHFDVLNSKMDSLLQKMDAT
jgi:hypothetical protein